MDQGDGVSESVWAPPTAAEPDPTALLPGYRDFHLMARGGDSLVYRAHQDALDRDVAIKVVQLDDDESIARFRRELAITVRLGRQHPHIMTVLATGTTSSGQPCLVMDHFELGSLHDRLAERGPLPVSEVVAAGSVIADALAFAHTQGVLHRDVKPQNVLVLPTSWVLADFGLARAIDAGHSSSLERFSYRHASPQVLDGDPPTVADDIYSLGSTLFTLLDGRAPYASDDPDEDSALSYLRRARTETPRSLTRDDVPLQLAGIVRRCLARDRAQRFPDAAALRAALDAVPTENRNWAPESEPVAAPAPPRAPEPAVTTDAGFAPPAALFAPSAPGTSSAEPAVVPAEPVHPPPAPVPPPTTSTAPLAAPLPSAPLPDAPVSLPPDAPVSVPLPPVGLPEAPPPVEPRVDSRPSGPFAPVPSAPGEREPDAPAVSALAQLPEPARANRDADATGLRPVQSPSAPPRHVAEPAPATRRRWVLVGVAGAVALALGVGIGFLRSSDDTTTAASPTTTPTPTPSVTGTVQTIPVISSVTPTAAPTRPLVKGRNPRITLYKRGVDDTIVLAWTDPSRGKGTFIISRTDDPSADGRRTADPGVTTAVIPGVPRGRHCFKILVLTANSNVIGPELCKTT